MALTRTKSNPINEPFRQRYSELSDEIRAKNKREDRLLDIQLKYYEREKNIRLNALRKEQHQLERTRSLILDRVHKMNQDKQKQLITSLNVEKLKLESSLIQLSNPELFNGDWEPLTQLAKLERLSSLTMDKPISPKKVVRPHSAV